MGAGDEIGGSRTSGSIESVEDEKEVLMVGVILDVKNIREK